MHRVGTATEDPCLPLGSTEVSGVRQTRASPLDSQKSLGRGKMRSSSVLCWKMLGAKAQS